MKKSKNMTMHVEFDLNNPKVKRWLKGKSKVKKLEDITFPEILNECPETIKTWQWKSLENKKNVYQVNPVISGQQLTDIITRLLGKKYILDLDAEDKQLKSHLDKLEKNKNIYTSTSFKEQKNYLKEKHMERIRQQIDIQEIIKMLRETFSNKTVVANVFKEVNIPIIDKRREEGYRKASELLKEIDKKKSEKLRSEAEESLIKTKKDYENSGIPYYGITPMLNIICLRLFNYLQNKVNKVVSNKINKVISEILQVYLSDENISSEAVRQYIKNAKTIK